MDNFCIDVQTAMFDRGLLVAGILSRACCYAVDAVYVLRGEAWSR